MATRMTARDTPSRSATPAATPATTPSCERRTGLRRSVAKSRSRAGVGADPGVVVMSPSCGPTADRTVPNVPNPTETSLRDGEHLVVLAVTVTAKTVHLMVPASADPQHRRAHAADPEMISHLADEFRSSAGSVDLRDQQAARRSSEHPESLRHRGRWTPAMRSAA